MTHDKTGGPAFQRDNFHSGVEGMTMRDWFAGQALTGAMANEAWDDAPLSAISDLSYNAADAMLAERAKGGGE